MAVRFDQAGLHACLSRLLIQNIPNLVCYIYCVLQAQVYDTTLYIIPVHNISIYVYILATTCPNPYCLDPSNSIVENIADSLLGGGNRPRLPGKWSVSIHPE